MLRRGKAVYLTKNGYGSMVVLSLGQYAALTEDAEMRLDEGDKASEADETRCSAGEVFGRIRKSMRYVFFRYLRKYLSSIVTYIAERLKNPEAANELIGDVENAVMKRSNYAESF